MNIPSQKIKIASEIELSVVSDPPQDVKDLLSSTIYGMKGGMQYRHTKAEGKIDQLPEPFFVTLRRQNYLLGTVGFMFRKMKLNNASLASYYVRYLSVNNKIKRKDSSVKKTKKKSFSRAKNNRLKIGISKLMLEHFSKPFIDKKESAVFYAFVDKDNLYSQSLCEQFDYKKIRSISTVIFSRIFPRKSSSVSKLKESEKEFVLQLLAEEYKHHNFYFTDHIFMDDNYFVIKQDGRMVAGLKASAIEWEIVHIPGISGFIIKNIFPALPFLSRLFSKDKFRFVAMEAVWNEPGFENKLIELMNSVCAIFQLHIAMVWLDNESIMKERLCKTKQLGILHQLTKEVSADVLARFINMTEEEIKSFYEKPVYVSSFDLT